MCNDDDDEYRSKYEDDECCSRIIYPHHFQPIFRFRVIIHFTRISSLSSLSSRTVLRGERQKHRLGSHRIGDEEEEEGGSSCCCCCRQQCPQRFRGVDPHLTAATNDFDILLYYIITQPIGRRLEDSIVLCGERVGHKEKDVVSASRKEEDVVFYRRKKKIFFLLAHVLLLSYCNFSSLVDMPRSSKRGEEDCRFLIWLHNDA